MPDPVEALPDEAVPDEAVIVDSAQAPGGDEIPRGNANAPTAGAPLPAPTGPAVAMSPGASIWCAPLRMRTSAARCEDLIDQMNSLEAGVGAFNPPRTMIVGKPTRVTLPIGLASEEAAVISAAGGPAGGAVTVAVQIGRFMTATLTGSGFAIEPVGSPDRDLGMSNREDWRWDVTPTAKGTQTLQVSVETFAQDADEARTRIALFRSDPIEISVDVTGEDARRDLIDQATREIGATTPLLETLTKWLGALAALVVAAGVVWWRVKGFGGKPEKDEDKPGEG